MQIIKLIEVSKSFKSKKALHNVSIEFNSNKIHGLLGPNGSGKTTLFNIVAGFLSPDVGDILLDYAKGNLDQAVEFLMKFGIYKMPETEIKTTGFGVKGSGFYGRSKGVIKSPYGTKTVEDDPEREIKLYPLKRLFNQTEKEITTWEMAKRKRKPRSGDRELYRARDWWSIGGA